MSDRDLVIAVPVYKDSLNLLEQFSVDYLLRMITGRKIVFIAPEKLDRTYYNTRYPNLEFHAYEDRYFASIIGYNHLLLNADFYASFEQYQYLLIYQTDALVFRDDLDMWMECGYDYLGAPWPQGVEVNLAVGRFAVDRGVNLKSYVGNGGFSLRSIKGSIRVLQEFADIKDYWVTCGSSEDLFFAFMGMLSDRFRVPNQMVASRFSLELEADRYFRMNHGAIPTGCHAWCKHDLAFWQKIVRMVG